jgi:hypothetical protein
MLFPGGKRGRWVRLTTLPPSCAVVTKSVNLNFLEPSGPLQTCNGPAQFYYYYLLQLSCHSVTVVFTLVQTKQIRINIHKRNNTKTQQIPVHILPKHPHNCQNTPHYKNHTHAHTQTIKQVKTTTVQDTHQMK